MPTSRSSSATRTIGLPADGVWAALTDLPALAEVRRHVTAVQVRTPGPFDAGTRWSETRTGRWRRPVTLDFTTETVLPGEGYEAVGTIGGTVCRVTFHLVRRAPGTTMVVSTFDVEHEAPRSAARRTLEVAFGTRDGRLFRRQMADDLADVERAARHRLASG